MTVRSRIVAAFALAFGFAGALLVSAKLSRNMISVVVYSDFESAQKSKAREWIPAFVPPTAVDIHEVHDLDTNMRWGFFRIGPERGFWDVGGQPLPLDGCRLHINTPTIDGWPLPDRSVACCADLRKAGWEVALIRDPGSSAPARADFMIATNRDAGLAAYWPQSASRVEPADCP